MIMVVIRFYLPGPLIISSSSQLPYSETFESGDEVEAVPLLLLLLLLLFSKATLTLLPSKEAACASVIALIDDGDDDDDSDDDDDDDEGETRCSTSERI